jgi:DNA-binding CsgD family transcriptional regulator
MRRRPPAAFHDPTGRSAFRGQIAQGVDAILSAAVLTERETTIVRLRFGLEDGTPRTLDEIGRMYSVTRARIADLERGAFTKLRASELIAPLRDLLDDDVPRARGDRATGQLIQCPQHRTWYFQEDGRPAVPTCGSCACALPRMWSGRPRKYCSDACRQQGHRRELRAPGVNATKLRRARKMRQGNPPASYAEIGRVLGLGPATVRRHLRADGTRSGGSAVDTGRGAPA